jgi:hypothetical protein
VQSQDVTVVVVTDGEGPLFGLSVTDPSSGTGPVQAVFNAARAAGVDPFARLFRQNSPAVPPFASGG